MTTISNSPLRAPTAAPNPATVSEPPFQKTEIAQAVNQLVQQGCALCDKLEREFEQRCKDCCQGGTCNAQSPETQRQAIDGFFKEAGWKPLKLEPMPDNHADWQRLLKDNDLSSVAIVTVENGKPKTTTIHRDEKTDDLYAWTNWRDEHKGGKATQLNQQLIDLLRQLLNLLAHTAHGTDGQSPVQQPDDEEEDDADAFGLDRSEPGAGPAPAHAPSSATPRFQDLADGNERKNLTQRWARMAPAGQGDKLSAYLDLASPQEFSALRDAMKGLNEGDQKKEIEGLCEQLKPVSLEELRQLSAAPAAEPANPGNAHLGAEPRPPENSEHRAVAA